MRYGTPAETAEQLLRAQEAVEEQGHQHEGKDKARIRKVATTVLRILGYKNTIDDIKLDNRQWQIHFGGCYLTNKEKIPVEQLIAEQLGIPAENVRLVGFCQ